MEPNLPCPQIYNGGIIFVSYIISVAGAMIALELLQRRTHIRGKYNWFLLFAAATSMGGVGIWSMHFIGNNSLTLIIHNGQHFQLFYSAGFTFVSLAVAIVTMFLAFAFVGITEEAKLSRIIPSGIVAGFGIVAMHYIGQRAINFFILGNKIPFVVGAATIAVCAVTAALLIFFKLREQWANQWYKRLGCAMLMAVAACGMHYTALVGTIYYEGDNDDTPPIPVMSTPALIGIIFGIVAAGCLILLAIVTKAHINSSKYTKNRDSSKRRLVLDTIFFDRNGRIMVKVDGIVPMKEILSEIPEDVQYYYTQSQLTIECYSVSSLVFFIHQEQYGKFSENHPLFKKIFEITLHWFRLTELNHYNNNDSDFPEHSNFDPAYKAFMTAAKDLVEELCLNDLSELGHLSDLILTSNTVSKKSLFSSTDSLKKGTIQRSNSTATSWLLLPNRRTASKGESDLAIESEQNDTNKLKSKNQKYTSSILTTTENATVIDIFTDSDTNRNNRKKLTIADSDFEDQHVFLVKRIESNKLLVHLLSIGFRFAEPTFIAKTMGEKLRVPTEYMFSYFQDMSQMAEAASVLYKPVDPFLHSTVHRSAAMKHHMDRFADEFCAGIFVGLFVLIDDDNEGPNAHAAPYVIIDKKKRYTFPVIQLTINDNPETEPPKRPSKLTSAQKEIIVGLSGETLATIASLELDVQDATYKNPPSISSPTQQCNTGSPPNKHHTTISISTLSNLTTPNEYNTSAKGLLDNNAASTTDDNTVHPDKYSFSFKSSSTSSTSASSLTMNADDRNFLKALKHASTKLIESSNYGKPIASSAKLYAEVLDIPAFAIRAGPCQLILFRAHIQTPGTKFAINQTLTEPIKCIPFPLYRSFVHHITDTAISHHRAERDKFKEPPSFLKQKRLYQSSTLTSTGATTTITANTNSSNIKGLTKNSPADGSGESFNRDISSSSIRNGLESSGAAAASDGYTIRTNSTDSSSQQQTFVSLPPPPRAKRHKLAFSSLDIINKDFIPSIVKGVNSFQMGPVNAAKTSNIVELNLLPTKDRFWWLEAMYEEVFTIV
ncbi:hypothetical protein BDF20DRAFT_837427 [Mycotypha africana]|uniref:uncharacterized protein n=1 Tax=Mycotypha africana TaxID=64632 RepID=UPI0023002421|nr:uncharacterized protein BDF20DRAFT_837427 [Mycotypha africana]KAI8973485.1 hypothetical protein BDF20DRAFT_837427 [Mycotypha africana]